MNQTLILTIGELVSQEWDHYSVDDEGDFVLVHLVSSDTSDRYRMIDAGTKISKEQLTIRKTVNALEEAGFAVEETGSNRKFKVRDDPDR